MLVCKPFPAWSRGRVMTYVFLESRPADQCEKDTRSGRHQEFFSRLSEGQTGFDIPPLPSGLLPFSFFFCGGKGYFEGFPLNSTNQKKRRPFFPLENTLGFPLNSANPKMDAFFCPDKFTGHRSISVGFPSKGAARAHLEVADLLLQAGAQWSHLLWQ